MIEFSLRTDESTWNDINSGTITFIVQRKFKSYEVGDILFFSQWDKNTSTYLPGIIECKINYILDDSDKLKDGYIILGFEKLKLHIIRSKIAYWLKYPFEYIKVKREFDKMSMQSLQEFYDFIETYLKSSKLYYAKHNYRFYKHLLDKKGIRPSE